MKFSMVLVGAASLALGACSHGSDLVVDGPNPPPAKPSYTTYAEAKLSMDDFIRAAGSNAVLFSTDSYHIDPIAADTLNRQADWLMSHPEVQVVVEGHADKRASDEYNIRLARRRANSVVDFFVMKGLTRERFVARSFGEGKPIINRQGDVQLNRRAVTVLVNIVG